MTTPERLCQDRVCVVTGAGRGLGREYALLLAREGARVVVNDLGGAATGVGRDATPAHDVVREITDEGGTAVANTDDVSDWSAAEALVAQAVDTFGRLDVLVNNAGVLRSRMIVSSVQDEVDTLLRVNLKGTIAPTHFAGRHWRDRAASGAPLDGRLINTTSAAGLYASVSQSVYGAAKAGIAAFTQVAAAEFARYGVTANAVAPAAATRLLAGLDLPAEFAARLDPVAVAPLIAWLASTESGDVTGEVLEASGGLYAIAEGWRRGPKERDVPVGPRAVGPVLRRLLADRRPRTTVDETLADT